MHAHQIQMSVQSGPCLGGGSSCPVCQLTKRKGEPKPSQAKRAARSPDRSHVRADAERERPRDYAECRMQQIGVYTCMQIATFAIFQSQQDALLITEFSWRVFGKEAATTEQGLLRRIHSICIVYVYQKHIF